MAKDIDITSTSKRVETDKSSEQAARLAAIEAKQAADRQEAQELQQAQEEAERVQQQEQEAAALREVAAKSQRENAEKLGAAAVAVGGAAVAAVAKGIADRGGSDDDDSTGNGKGNGKLIAILVVIALVFLVWLAWPRIQAALSPEPEPHTITALSNQGIMGSTQAFGDAILGEARQKQELVVYEQDVEVESSITQALANLEIFSKTKVIHSFGTGVYTVDMSKIDTNAIAVTDNPRTVTLTIPHTQLQYITKNLEATQFEDTQRGLLGFGEVKLTQEQQNILERSIEDSMREQLESEEVFADADKAALLVVYDAYQPVIAKVDSSFALVVKFAE